ncbi:hypothetical protein CDAR_526521 [Caerostris darwini]|uniref:Uncharacterized protein n=1 Tax=Caerostris darwini TaxID=1538125 RepID=A0AAV4T7D5_9ARAC|nr:hypothetical protein CDAR_526521 [Caerostris darwini]
MYNTACDGDDMIFAKCIIMIGDLLHDKDYFYSIYRDVICKLDLYIDFPTQDVIPLFGLRVMKSLYIVAALSRNMLDITGITKLAIFSFILSQSFKTNRIEVIVH